GRYRALSPPPQGRCEEVVSEPGAFHHFEQAGWERAAEAYDDAFGPLTLQSIEPLLDAVGAAAGQLVLDVACGPGDVSATAAARGCITTGVDFSFAMVQHARAKHSPLQFREGDASRLAFGAASFDAVVMNFGMLHLESPDQAIEEALRVLKPGGRY